MNRILLIVYLTLFSLSSFSQLEKKYLNNETYTYDELIESYNGLADKHSNATLQVQGYSDFLKPIYSFTIEPISLQDSDQESMKEVATILVNNAIHPGESCGVDASLHFAEDVLSGKIQAKCRIVIIPAYNIGGMYNRREHTRANQNGPKSQGFRGNANNYDLNRDFTKADTRNTLAFYSIFEKFKPQFFIDNHTTNGADYQYEQTLIFSAPEKYPSSLKESVKDFKSQVFKGLKKEGVVAGNFVNIYGQTPDKGFAAFHETPIYSTGFTNLFNTFSIVSETHMLKDYPTRVEATYALLKTVVQYANENGEQLKVIMDAEVGLKEKTLPIRWEIDSTKVEQLKFKGFEYEYLKSEVTSGQRLHYTDKKKTYTIDYLGTFKPEKIIEVPEYYIVHKSWSDIQYYLTYLNIRTKPAVADIKQVEVYRIENYKTSQSPYEGHYPHRNITVSKTTQSIELNEDY
ncbi:MAG: hypothetical protein N4A46_12615, partial [Schleiferiaceae bacterium]|nr:hypothetical protein [Schleiferiaceae bacterium]